MFIGKIINNNVIIAVDDKQQVIVAMGRGIGFQAKTGQPLDESKIEKRFIMASKAETGQFGELVRSIPLEHLRVCMDIIDYAGQVIKKRLSNSIYISLTDHINFALERFKAGLLMENPLLQEVRSFYPGEYLIGEYAIALIKRELNVQLPIDESASIALHFVNAEYNAAMSDTMNITALIRRILDLVEKELATRLDVSGLHYSRFVTHLKFLAYRIFRGQQLTEQDDELDDMIIRLYGREYKISEKIARFIKNEYGRELSRGEKVYLTIHIRRVQPISKEEEYGNF